MLFVLVENQQIFDISLKALLEDKIIDCYQDMRLNIKLMDSSR